MGHSVNTSYEEYVHNQTVVYGQTEKPERYAVAELRAIDHLFADVPKDASVLDVGCGTGVGITYLRSLGFDNVAGMELNPEKAEVAGAVNCDIARFALPVRFEVFYSSHSFEHMYDPATAIENMMDHAGGPSLFIFILPYPDEGPETAHCASSEIGLRDRDSGRSVIEWFEQWGLTLLERKFDSYREPEIWLKFRMVE